MSSSGFLPVTSNTSSAIFLMILARGVVVLVDAVAEAHQAAFAGLHLLDELGDVVDRADLVEHPQHGLVGAAVQRAVERGAAPASAEYGSTCELPTRASRWCCSSARGRRAG
jgi:hypothetical protein